jgi:hypothetical protein
VSAASESRLAALKRRIAEGIADLEHGRFRVYSAEDGARLAEEISQRGRARLQIEELRWKARRKK